jgi:hypothetical protein
MKKTLITAIIWLCSLAGYAQHQFVVKLKNIATVTFPDTAKTNITNLDTAYTCVKSGAIYLASATNAQKSVKDLLTSHVLDSIYNNVAVGTIQSSNGKILYKKKIFVKGLEGMEFGYTVNTNGQKLYGYSQTLYLNSVLLIVGRWSADSLKSDDKNLKEFFGTFKVKLKEDEIRQGNTDEIAYKVGYGIGAAAFIGVILLIGGLFVFIIRKVAYRKNKG